jgi:pSer/pThr/pTyr-binding forkhead associated (FHA) protein
MFRADGERRSFSIVRDMTVVGRREDCDLRIPLGEVSRKHCRLIMDGEAVRLEDLGSSNGTFHNGERVREATLAPGDTVQIGPVTFMVQIDGVPADEDMQPDRQRGRGRARRAGRGRPGRRASRRPGGARAGR